MIEHKVQEGEHLSRIAHAYGHRKIAPVWNLPDNASLKSERLNPHVLNPGDVVAVPELEVKETNAPTDQAHRFQIADERLKLGLKLIGPAGILSGTACEVQVGFDSQNLTADSKGEVFRPVAPDDEKGRVVIHLEQPNVTMSLDLDLVLLLGHLRPAKTREGQTARLLNLGYLLSEDDDDEESFRSAVEEFQCDNKLQIDGKCGPATQAKLTSVHGS
jgi:hypothetical protein